MALDRLLPGRLGSSKELTHSKTEQHFALESERAKLIFDLLVETFVDEYMRKRRSSDDSGWRSLPRLAEKLRVTPSSMYGKHGGYSPELQELLRRGLIETRIFPRERGRGGEATRIRITYDREPIKAYVMERIRGTSEQAAILRTSLPTNRLAILPLTSLSPDLNDEYFADGLTEELISTMSKISGLEVIARTSVNRYKGSSKSIYEIARELRSGSVLEGSVRKAGQRVRITVQLIDPLSSGLLWTDNYDRELKDILAVQSEISRTVAEALRVKLRPAEHVAVEKEHGTTSKSYMHYLKGRYFWNERTKEGVGKALEYFKSAIQTDSEFAPGHSGMADCYNMFGNSLWMAPGKAYPLAMECCKKALDIDGDLAEAHASHGWTAMVYLWDFETAEKEFKRAIRLRPNYPAAYQWYATMMFFLRDYEEARIKAKRALELDPFSRTANTEFATYLASLGRTGEAMEKYKQIIELNPDFASVHFWKSAVHVWLREYDEGIEEAKAAVTLDPSPLREQFLAWAYAEGGKKDRAQEILERLGSGKTDEYVSPVWTGMIELSLNRAENGYRWLEKSFADRNQALLYFRGMPWFEEYRLGPRWQRIDDKIGLRRRRQS